MIVNAFYFIQSLVYPQYYCMQTNLKLAASSTGLFLASIFSFIVSFNVFDATSTNVLFGFCIASFVLGSVLGYFLCKRRLTALTVTDKDIEENDEGEFVSLIVKKVQFRFDFEIISRSLVRLENVEKSKRFAKWLFEKAIEKYPRSTFVHGRYVVMLSSFCQESSQNSPYTKYILQKTMHMDPSFTVRYSFFYLEKSWELDHCSVESGEGHFNVMDAVQYKHDTTLATTHHTMALQASIEFWKAVQQKKEDAWTLSSMAKEIEDNERNSKWYYKRLMKRFPNSTKVIRLFATYVRDVDNNENLSDELSFYADDLEEQLAKAKKHNVKGGVQAAGVSVRSGLGRSRNASVSSGSSIEFGGSAIFQSNHLPKTTMTEMERTSSNFSLALSNLRQGTLAIIIINYLIFLGCFLVTKLYYFNDISNDLAKFVSLVQLPSMEVEGFAYTRQLEMYKADPQVVSAFQSHLASVSVNFTKTFTKIRMDPSLVNDDILATWEDPVVGIRIFNKDSGYLNTNISLYQTCSEYSSLLELLSSDPLIVIQQLLYNSTEFRYIMDNGYATIFYSLVQLFQMYELNYRKLMQQTERNFQIATLVLALVPLIVSFTTVHYLLQKLRSERLAVWNLFNKINYPTIRGILDRQTKALKNFVTSDAVTGKANALKSKKKMKIRSERMRHKNFRSMLQKGSEMRVVSRMAYLMFFEIIISSILIALVVGLLALLSSYCFSAGFFINSSSARMGMVGRLKTMAIELVHFDQTTWQSRDQIRTIFANDIDMTASIHHDLKFGNVADNIQASFGNNPEQDSILVDRTCADNSQIMCSGLDQLMTAYLDVAKIIVTLPDSALTFDNQFVRQLMYIADSAQFNTLLYQSSNQYITSSDNQVLGFEDLENGLLIIASVFVLVILIIVMVRLKQIESATSISRKMLKSIPPSNMEAMKDVKYYLENGVVMLVAEDDKKEEAFVPTEVPEPDNVDYQKEQSEVEDVMEKEEKEEKSNIKATASLNTPISNDFNQTNSEEFPDMVRENSSIKEEAETS